VTTYYGIWSSGSDAIYRGAAVMEGLVLVMFAEGGYFALLSKRHAQRGI
jgi:hypothetical protein